jgi:DNA-binding transcriptional MocR family regulator
MAVTPDTRRWDELFAARTRGAGDGIAAILAFAGLPDLISFAGGFPDPLTFPRERASALLQEFAATGEASAFQYAPTRGWPGRSTRSPGGSTPSRAAGPPRTSC